MQSDRRILGGRTTLDLALLLALASTAAGAGLIGSDTNGNLYDVNQITGSVSNPRATGISYLSGIAYSPSGTLYGLSLSIVSGGTPVGSLYTINPTTGASVLVGAFGLTAVYEGDLAFDPTSGKLYGVQDQIDNDLYLFSINPSTGAGADIGIVSSVGNCQSVCDLSAMAFDASGNLYVVDTGTPALIQVNKTTGAVISNVGLNVTGLGIVGGLSIDPATGVAYYASGNGGSGASTSSLYTLNLSTSTLTLVGSLTGTSVGLSGLAFPPIPSPSLGITKTHAGDFLQGQANAQYTVTVTDNGGATRGPITVTDTIPSGLTLVSMSGAGWNCTTNTCNRTDVLSPGGSFPAITVTVSVASNAPSQVTNQVTAAGGGSAPANASDLTNVGLPACSYSFSNSPASAGSGTSTGSAQLVTSLTNCPYTSVVSNNPDWIAITSGLTGSGSGAIGYSVIATNNSGGPRTGSFTVFNTVSNRNVSVATLTINQAAASCSSLSVTPTQFTFGAGGGTGTVNFNTSPCTWSITGNPSWVVLSPNSGNAASFNFTVSPNPSPGATRQATLSINNGALTVGITQSGLVCTYTITDATAGFGASRSFGPAGGSGGINVTAPAGCNWTATTNQSFISFSGSPPGIGNGSVSYSAASNSSSTTAQTGTINIAGLAYVITVQPPGSPSYSCSASSTTPAQIPPEGFSEKVSDVVFTCGGQSAPAGGFTGDIRVSFNAAITSRLLSTGQTEMLLLEDEPTAASLALGTNTFRGILTSINGSSAVLFSGVQLATVSGGTFLHTWRITNARVNAQTLAAGGTVQATVAITATAPFTVTGQPTVANVSTASTFSVPAATTTSGQTVQPVTFAEGFATVFGPKVLAGQDPSQAGTVYNSESGYVNSAKLGSQTGFATNGTRLIATIANVPAGVSAYAPVAPASGTNAQIVTADSTGAGGFLAAGTTQFGGVAYQQVTLTGGAGTATWEVTASDSTKVETLTFNLLLLNPNNTALAGVKYAGALAPVSAGPAPQLPSTTLPLPRFASSTVVVGQPSTVSLSVSPQASGAQGQQGAALKASLRSEATPSSSVVGGTVSWTQVQANTGAAASTTAPNVSVGGTLPPTWVITGCTALDSGGTCPTIDPNNPSSSYTVNYPSLSPGQTGTIMLTAQSTTQTSGTVELTSSIDSDLANTNSTGESFTTNFPVSEIGLNVSLTHSANFSQGQNGAQYTATVSNGGTLPTSLPVTLTETLPTGLTLVSMSGTGWTCTLSTSSCTRSDALVPNSSYPSVTITVNVSSTAPSSVTNQVAATTGVLQAAGSDPTNITQVTGTPAFFNGEASLGSNVFYLQFPDGNLFGYYNLQSFPIFYHYDMGFEAFVDGGSGAAFMYDFTSGHWFYTSASLFPYLYDFTLNNWLYYFPANNNAGHYSSNPRFFSDLTTGKIISM